MLGQEERKACWLMVQGPCHAARSLAKGTRCGILKRLWRASDVFLARYEPVEYHLPPATYSGSLGGTTYVYVSSNPVTLYADAGSSVLVGASRSALAGTANVTVSLSGYL